MTTLFISDLHLDESRPAVTRAFFQFLAEHAATADALYILGDFFEVWIGDDDDDPFNRTIVDALAQLNTPLYVMCGNRDFLLGQRFAAETGATLLTDPTVIDLYGQPVLLMHGDSLCTRDTAYMAFRQQARSPAWQQAMLSKPLAERRAIALHLRQQSQNNNNLKAEDIMDVTAEEVILEMSAAGVTTLIHGHTHRPARHQVSLDQQDGERIVLGDWHANAWWIAASPGAIDLLSQPISD